MSWTLVLAPGALLPTRVAIILSMCGSWMYKEEEEGQKRKMRRKGRREEAEGEDFKLN